MGDGKQSEMTPAQGSDSDSSGGEDGCSDQPPAQSPRAPLELSIDDDGAMRDAQRAWLADVGQHAIVCAAARADTPPSGGSVRVRVIGDDEMATLHARHAGETGTTDVLTFDLREDLDEPLDTDIVVCVDEARRQAETRGLSVERELLLYILHGVLHCLGHDDHDEEAYRRMHLEEDSVLREIGIGETFAPRAGDAS